MSSELDSEVDLLIGYNPPQALHFRDVISCNEDQPFAQRVVLCWRIIGFNNYEDEDLS